MARRDLTQEDLAVAVATHYGAGACNATTLSAAISAQGSTPNILLIPRIPRNSTTTTTWALASNVTVPKTLSLQCPRGTLLQPALGTTLTLGATPLAGDYQIFDANETTTGAVRFSAGACPVVKLAWWGPAMDGTTNDATKWNAAMTAAASANAILEIPGGTLFAGTTTLKHYPNVDVRGISRNGTTLLWGAAAVAYAMADSAGNITPDVKDQTSRVTLQDLTLDGNAAATNGIHWYSTTRSRIRNVQILDFTGIGLHIRGGKTGAGTFYTRIEDSEIIDCGTGVRIESGADNHPHQTTFFGCQLGSNTLAIHSTGTASAFAFTHGSIEAGSNTEIRLEASGRAWHFEYNYFENMTLTLHADNNGVVFRANQQSSVTWPDPIIGNDAWIEHVARPFAVATTNNWRMDREGTGSTIASGRMRGDVADRVRLTLDGIKFSGGGSIPSDGWERIADNVIAASAGMRLDLYTNEASLELGDRNPTLDSTTWTPESGNIFLVTAAAPQDVHTLDVPDNRNLLLVRIQSNVTFLNDTGTGNITTVSGSNIVSGTILFARFASGDNWIAHRLIA